MSGQRANRRRLPDCMLCVLDHLAPGLPPGEQALLIRLARHAHHAGCGIYPGQRGLADDLGTTRDTLRVLRDRLLERRLLDRLPRVGPHGADLYRLRLCPDCQRTTRVVQKRREVQGEPADHPDHVERQAAPVVHLRPAQQRGTDPPVPRTPPADRERSGRDGPAAGSSGPTADGGPQP
jgi:hypothetical protein